MGQCLDGTPSGRFLQLWSWEGTEKPSIALKIAGPSRTTNSLSKAEIGVGVGVGVGVWTQGRIGPTSSSHPPIGPRGDLGVSTDTIALGTSTGTPKGEGDASRSEGDA